MVRKFLTTLFFLVQPFVTQSSCQDVVENQKFLKRNIAIFLDRQYESTESSPSFSSDLLSQQNRIFLLFSHFLGKEKRVNEGVRSVVWDTLLHIYKDNVSDIKDQMEKDILVHNKLLVALKPGKDEQLTKLCGQGYIHIMQSNNHKTALLSFDRVPILSRFHTMYNRFEFLLEEWFNNDLEAMRSAVGFVNQQSNGCCLDFSSYDQFKKSLGELDAYLRLTDMVRTMKEALRDFETRKTNIDTQRHVQRIVAEEEGRRLGVVSEEKQCITCFARKFKNCIIKQQEKEKKEFLLPFFQKWRESFDAKLLSFRANEQYAIKVEKSRAARSVLLDLPEEMHEKFAQSDSVVIEPAEKVVALNPKKIETEAFRKIRRVARIAERERKEIVEKEQQEAGCILLKKRCKELSSKLSPDHFHSKYYRNNMIADNSSQTENVQKCTMMQNFDHNSEQDFATYWRENRKKCFCSSCYGLEFLLENERNYPDKAGPLLHEIFTNPAIALQAHQHFGTIQ